MVGVKILNMFLEDFNVFSQQEVNEYFKDVNFVEVFQFMAKNHYEVIETLTQPKVRDIMYPAPDQRLSYSIMKPEEGQDLTMNLPDLSQ